jgi:hypothetical protein
MDIRTAIHGLTFHNSHFERGARIPVSRQSEDTCHERDSR